MQPCQLKQRQSLVESIDVGALPYRVHELVVWLHAALKTDDPELIAGQTVDNHTDWLTVRYSEHLSGFENVEFSRHTAS
jgi:hypothetical protein